MRSEDNLPHQNFPEAKTTGSVLDSTFLIEESRVSDIKHLWSLTV